MKTFEFSKDSWHYKIVDTWDSRLTRWTDNVDLCEYVRALIFAMILYGFICAMALTLVFANLYMIANTFSFLFLGYVLDPFTVIVGITEIVMGSLVGFILWNEKRKLHEIENPSKPGFIGLAYRGWKEKFCARIEFK